jgi:hypothetical protein
MCPNHKYVKNDPKTVAKIDKFIACIFVSEQKVVFRQNETEYFRENPIR